MRYFHTYQLSDGRFVASRSTTGAPARVLWEAPEGHAVIEHTGPVDFEFDRVDLTTKTIVDTSSKAFAADLEAKFAGILATCPQLAEAVPPAPPPAPQRGSHRFAVDAFWSEFAERARTGAWRLRCTAESTHGLTGPFYGRGDCLAPVFSEGQLSWYAPRLPAQDGDIVLVRWDARELERIYRRGCCSFEWLKKYPDPWPIATKLLVALAGEYWLITNSSMLRLGRNRILGVLCRRESESGERIFEAPVAEHIAPNAATEIYSARDDGPDSFNPAAGGDGYLSLSGSGISDPGVLNGSLSIDAQIANVATILNIALQVTWSGGSESTASAQPFHTDMRTYSFQHSFTTLPPNTPWTMRVAMSGNANATVQRAQLRAEVIKR